MQIILFLVGVVLLNFSAAHSQVARLAQHGSGTLDIEAGPGDTLLIDLSAELGRYQAAGVTIYLQVSDGFRVLNDESAGGPFVPGDLFEGGLIVRNQEVSHGLVDLPAGNRLLEFTTLLGPSATPRGRGGSGSIACFRVLCERIATGDIRIFRSPLHESRVVLEDGRTEKTLLLAPPVHIKVDRDTAVPATPWGLLKSQR
jgi:hypothetical protein